MDVTIEQNEKGENVKVTTYASGTVVRELDRPAPSPVAVVSRVSKLGFVQRLTDDEYQGLLTLAKTNVAVEAWLKKFDMAAADADGTSIDLTDPRTIAGVRAMFGAERAAEILTP